MIKTKPYPDITLEFQENPYHKFFVNGRAVKSITHYTGVIDKSGPLMGWQEKLTRTHLLEALKNGSALNEALILAACSLHRVKK